MDRIPTGRSSTSPDHHHLPAVDNANPNSASLAFHSIRNRFLVKRNPNSLPLPPTSTTAKSSSSASSSSHPPWRGVGAACGTRSHHHGGGRSAARKLLMFPFRGCGRSMFYLCIFVAVCAFALAYMMLQSSVASMMYRQATGSSSSERQGEDREDLKLVPVRMMPQGEFEHDWLRNQSRIGIRSPRLGLVRTVKVSNVSLGASEQDIKEFFSFSGEIEYVEMQSENERAQTAFVTFKDLQGAETAVLLSSVTIALAPDYKLPPTASATTPGAENQNTAGAGSAVQKAVDVVSSMLAKGFILGKDAVNKAKSFDEKMRLTSTATATVASLDQKIGLSEKINMGTTIMNDKVKEMDQKFQVSEKTKSAIAAAEQTVSSAGSAIMKNRYVLTGTPWVTGAFNKMTKAGAGSAVQKAEDVVSSMLTKGFILGKDAVNKAKSFDEKMRLTSTATATVASLDQKIGLSEKINMGTTIVNDKVKEMDKKFQVSEKTKSAIAAAEQTVSSAGSAIMKNRYVLTGTSWVTGAFNKVSKAAGEVGQKTKEKMTEEEHGRNVAQGYALVHDPDSKSEQPSAKPGPVQGLIL